MWFDIVTAFSGMVGGRSFEVFTGKDVLGEGEGTVADGGEIEDEGVEGGAVLAIGLGT